MTGFWKCVLYLALSGSLSFLLGRFLPKRWFDGAAFPFHDWPFERQGNLYRRVYIHKWQSHLPDMSRVFRKWMPPKCLSGDVTSAQVEVMVQETCIAEVIHVILCVTGLAMIWLWPGVGGFLCYLFGALLGNLPFIMVQRFNRPKLLRLMEMLRKRGL